MGGACFRTSAVQQRGMVRACRPEGRRSMRVVRERLTAPQVQCETSAMSSCTIAVTASGTVVRAPAVEPAAALTALHGPCFPETRIGKRMGSSPRRRRVLFNGGGVLTTAQLLSWNLQTQVDPSAMSRMRPARTSCQSAERWRQAPFESRRSSHERFRVKIGRALFSVERRIHDRARPRTSEAEHGSVVS